MNKSNAVCHSWGITNNVFFASLYYRNPEILKSCMEGLNI